MSEKPPETPDNILRLPGTLACPGCGAGVRRLPAGRPLPPGLIARAYSGPVYECVGCGKAWTAEEVRP
ncbi:MAG TPA: hypothetical protein VFG53_01710 [Anaeromyxobacter sp.]|nr:hypothetical protein [Anaeromyxobacter sp.]